MDFIVDLPPCNSFSIIMVIVDGLLKLAHFCALKYVFTSQQVVELCMHNVVKIHGMPNSIVSDHDKVFISNL